MARTFPPSDAEVIRVRGVEYETREGDSRDVEIITPAGVVARRKRPPFRPNYTVIHRRSTLWMIMASSGAAIAQRWDTVVGDGVPDQRVVISLPAGHSPTITSY